jgi:hypothetical protein
MSFITGGKLYVFTYKWGKCVQITFFRTNKWGGNDVIQL